MLSQRFNSIFGFTFCLLLAGDPFGSGQDERPGLPATEVVARETPSVVLSKLQAAHESDSSTFVVQEELDCLIRKGGGGACASAAGIDLLQVMRLMAGLEQLPNPHKVVLSSFEDQNELLNGRVTNEQFVRLMDFYEQHLENADVNVELQSAPDSPYAVDDTFQASDRLTLLRVNAASLFAWKPEPHILTAQPESIVTLSKNQFQNRIQRPARCRSF